MIKCSKAIIPVAGYGTRRLPITKAIEKCMLPIGNRPLVDYVVEDCLKAGVKDVYFVVGQDSRQIRDYYQTDNQLEAYLEAKGKADMIESIRPASGVSFHFVEQSAGGKYGTAVPIGLCQDLIEPDEYFLVMMGDDFIFNHDPAISQAKRLIDAVADGQAGAILGVAVDKSAVSSYGVIAAHADGDRSVYDSIQEKPSPEKAASNLINVSKYCLKGDFMEQVAATLTAPPDASGEYYITDSLNRYVGAGAQLSVVEADGKYLDGGKVDSWLEANNYVLGN
ncbi:MAG TPA: sugar phosphate nucleotidyltransferase [Candidatus Saccharimonadales bacterium]|nr:sugar phosphate nucleotidyltransferase [Candidatus Saccharimonadales bacterium]